FDYIIVAVSDMDRSVRFYRDQMGLTLKFESKEWTEFQTGPTTLALHPARQTRVEKTNSSELVAGSCSLGLNVSDLEAIFKQLQSTGVPFVMNPTERVNEGIRLAVCLDPDGLPISIAQTLLPPKNEPLQVTP
ncbi:MAG TPA: VOC family protein, partial [Candidatus Bathyarchaeia archaeon]|nr:VOC family protein [Candidatus Bathyarchaeia archaeon]